jgi:hypothetical protein
MNTDFYFSLILDQASKFENGRAVQLLGELQQKDETSNGKDIVFSWNKISFRF